MLWHLIIVPTSDIKNILIFYEIEPRKDLIIVPASDIKNILIFYEIEPRFNFFHI